MKTIQLLSVTMLAVLLMGCSKMTDVENTIPTVMTGDVVSVTPYTATIAVEGTDYQYYYLELSTSSSFSDGSSTKITEFNTEEWKATGLLSGTTYYYRQCATDGLTVVTGPTRQFDTPPLVGIASIMMAPWNEPTAKDPVASSEIGLFFSSVDDGTDYPGLANFQSSYNTATGKWSMPIEITPPDDPHKFYGYAPYSRTANNKQAIPVDLLKANTDYLCGESGNVTYTDCNASIVMHHALARVVFDVKKDKENNVDVTVSGYSLQGNAAQATLPVTGTLDLTMGTIKPTQLAGTISRSIASTLLKEEATEMDFYVIPCEFETGVLTFALGSDTFSSSLPAVEWKAGYQYRYPVTVKRNKLLVGDVEITPWTERTGGNIVINN